MKRFYEYRHLVTFADTNLVGNVYFTNHLEWQGVCREHFLAEHAPGVIERLADDLALVTVSCSCEYFLELYALDQVSVRMSLRGIEANRVSMEFTYFRVNTGLAQLVARGEQTIACLARKDNGLVPVDVPEELRAALDAYAGRPA